jgi:hypothetical protein
MRQNLSADIAECYRHASDARERAEHSRDPATKADFLDLERRWTALARSYELTTRIEDGFSQEVHRRQSRK